MIGTTMIGIGTLGVTLVAMFKLEEKGVIQINEKLMKGVLSVGVGGLSIWLISTILNLFNSMF